MLLLDKGYFDYDFEKVEKEVRWEDTIKSDEEVSDMLAMFGMGPKVQAARRPETAEEIQDYLIKNMKEE
jgi:hypothetical protein